MLLFISKDKLYNLVYKAVKRANNKPTKFEDLQVGDSYVAGEFSQKAANAVYSHAYKLGRKASINKLSDGNMLVARVK